MRTVSLRGSMAGLWIPYRRFAVALADGRARLRVDAGRYSFIVSDLHRLFLPVSPAQCEKLCIVLSALRSEPVREPEEVFPRRSQPTPLPLPVGQSCPRLRR